MLATKSNDNAYSLQVYQNEELKSLTRYRFDKASQRSKLKQSLSRLITILFPELEFVVSSLHSSSVYAMLMKYPSAKDVAKSQLHSLTNLLESISRGKICRHLRFCQSFGTSSHYQAHSNFRLRNRRD